MRRFLKISLLWLLIAALPLQGIAAATKNFCGPEHHEMMSHEDDVSFNAVMPQDHGEHDHMMMAETNTSPDQAPKSPHPHKHSVCSSCASCCVGAVAPPITLNQFCPPSLSESVYVIAAPTFVGFIPAGPERPPRYIFA